MTWCEKLYNDLGEKYLDYDFTKGTRQEVDFLEGIFNYDSSVRILDVGCGAGRHTIELVKRGYNAIGFDLSMRQLKVANNLAKKSNVRIKIVRADARDIPFTSQFDWVLSLCEGAYGLLETDQQNEDVLAQVHIALKPGGKFLLNVLNAAFVFRHPEYDSKIDVKTCTGYWTERYTNEAGEQKQLDCSNRYYTFPEIKLLLEKYGFNVLDGWGCQAGNFRKKQIELDDFEMLILAEKSN